MVLTLKREFPLQVGEESPSRMEEFNYFRVLFMSEARDWQKDCSNVNGDAEAFLVCCGKEEPEHESQAVALPVKLCPYPHLWPRAQGSDWKNEIVDTRDRQQGVP